jgi:ABC-type branched-subunit amino acid transport system permease subunit
MRALAPYVLIFAAALLLPLFANDYWAVIGARAAVYWVLVAGLNLVVGYGGQLAIGWVALLTLGSIWIRSSPTPPAAWSDRWLVSSSACRRCGCGRSTSR